MPPSLSDLVRPEHTAVLTMEMQRGIIGDLAHMDILGAEMAASGSLAGAVSVVKAGRSAGVNIIHCTALYRPDLRGSKQNCKILAVGAKGADVMTVGTPGAEVIPDLEPTDSDIYCPRFHGLAPFLGTELDALLRNLGVETVVATGCSVNIGIFGMALGAVDLGYQVVVPRDAVAGVPREYAETVLDQSISLLATIVTAKDLVEVWQD